MFFYAEQMIEDINVNKQVYHSDITFYHRKTLAILEIISSTIVKWKEIKIKLIIKK